MIPRHYLIRALQDVGYQRDEMDWWSDDALEFEYSYWFESDEDDKDPTEPI